MTRIDEVTLTISIHGEDLREMKTVLLEEFFDM
jgi:hypothetical protein